LPVVATVTSTAGPASSSVLLDLISCKNQKQFIVFAVHVTPTGDGLMVFHGPLDFKLL
jgi:hypothetical protein